MTAPKRPAWDASERIAERAAEKELERTSLRAPKEESGIEEEESKNGKMSRWSRTRTYDPDNRGIEKNTAVSGHPTNSAYKRRPQRRAKTDVRKQERKNEETTHESPKKISKRYQTKKSPRTDNNSTQANVKISRAWEFRSGSWYNKHKEENETLDTSGQRNSKLKTRGLQVQVARGRHRKWPRPSNANTKSANAARKGAEVNEAYIPWRRSNEDQQRQLQTWRCIRITAPRRGADLTG